MDFWNTVKNKQDNNQPKQLLELNHQLTSDELELIMRLLGQTSFPVKDIETLYVALLKLQEQHKSLINAGKNS